MGDDVLSFTELPNLHPAVVHFPLALAPIAALFDVAGLTVARREPWIRQAATALWVLAALGALGARLSGERAAAGLSALSTAAEQVLAAHADQSLIATIALALVALTRLLLANAERTRPRPLIAAGTVHLALGIAALGALSFTADLGGRLVYHHGVATTPQPRDPLPRSATAAAPDDGEADSRLSIDDTGRIDWRPASPASLGGGISIESLSGPRALTPLESAGPGLGFAVDGRGLLALPGLAGDLQMTAELEVGQLSGTLALVHHRGRGEDRLELHRTAAGTLTVRLMRDDRILDEARLAESDSHLTLTASAAGRHLKGFVDDRLVVHGHAEELPPGAVGLLTEGRGMIRLYRLEVMPGP